MYTTKRSQKYRHQYLLCLLGKFIALVLILNASKCQCKSGSPDAVGSLKIAAKSKLLEGDKDKKIKITFSIGDTGTPVELKDFTLKASIVEQNTFAGTTTGTTVTYTNGANEVKTFSATEPLKETLTELDNVVKELDPAHIKNSFKDFNLEPDKDAIEVKLKFELLNADETVVDHVYVRWIKSEFAINFPYGFKGLGNETYFTLKPLKEDIRDLTKYRVELTSNKPDVSFVFRESKEETTATLKKLLKRSPTTKLTQGKETNPIIIVAKPNEGELAAKLTVLVYPSDAAQNSKPIGQEEIEWHGYTEDPTTEKEQQDVNEIQKIKQQHEADLKRIKEAHQTFDNKNKTVKEEFIQTENTLKDEKLNKLADLKLKLKKKEIEKDDYKKQKQAINKDFKEKVRAAKEKFNNKKKEIRKGMKENKGQQKDQNNKIKADSKKEKKEKKEAKAAAKAAAKHQKQKYDSTEAPKLVLIAKKGLVTDKPFIVTIKNIGRPLEKAELANIKLWYEIANSTGDTSKVFLKALADSKDSKELKHQARINLTQVTNINKAKLKRGEGKNIALEINGIDLVKNMQISIHVEVPNSQQPVPPAIVEWEESKPLHE